MSEQDKARQLYRQVIFQSVMSQAEMLEVLQVPKKSIGESTLAVVIRDGRAVFLDFDHQEAIR